MYENAVRLSVCRHLQVHASVGMHVRVPVAVGVEVVLHMRMRVDVNAEMQVYATCCKHMTILTGMHICTIDRDADPQKSV